MSSLHRDGKPGLVNEPHPRVLTNAATPMNPSGSPPQQSLQDAFRDPSSPYHIAPGTQGPAHPEDHNNLSDYGEIEEQRLIAEEGRRKLLELGYDPTSFWEQQIVWGDHDSFQ